MKNYEEFTTAQHLSLHHLLSCRRDVLLLLLLDSAIVLWVWERGLLLVAGGSVVSAALFLLILALLREAYVASHTLYSSQASERVSPFLMNHWARWVLLLSTLPATLLVARAAWEGLGSSALAALLALLALSWQLWLYFWVSESLDVL